MVGLEGSCIWIRLQWQVATSWLVAAGSCDSGTAAMANDSGYRRCGSSLLNNVSGVVLEASFEVLKGGVKKRVMARQRRLAV